MLVTESCTSSFVNSSAVSDTQHHPLGATPETLLLWTEWVISVSYTHLTLPTSDLV